MLFEIVIRQVEFIAVERAFSAQRVDVADSVTRANHRGAIARRPGEADARRLYRAVRSDEIRARVAPASSMVPEAGSKLDRRLCISLGYGMMS